MRAMPRKTNLTLTTRLAIAEGHDVLGAMHLGWHFSSRRYIASSVKPRLPSAPGPYISNGHLSFWSSPDISCGRLMALGLLGARNSFRNRRSRASIK
jgi:hypothetical protein